MNNTISLKPRSIGRIYDQEAIVKALKAEGINVLVVTPESIKQSKANSKGRACTSKELIDRLNLINRIND